MALKEKLTEELWDRIRSIPPGRCTSYGALGRALANPVSGYLVGRWMTSCPEDAPWWRVVAKDGSLPLYKREPMLGLDQRQRLEREGVSFRGDCVDMAACGVEPD